MVSPAIRIGVSASAMTASASWAGKRHEIGCGVAPTFQIP